MRCKHCTLEIEKNGERWFHVSGMFWCAKGDTYAEPEVGVKITVKDGVVVGVEIMKEGDAPNQKKISGAAAELVEEKRCGCGEGAVGSCENCGKALCVDCDSGRYEDVMVCGDEEACEKRLRRKAVADASRSLFPGAELI